MDKRVLFFVFSYVSSINSCPESCACDDRSEYVTCTGDGHLGFPGSIAPEAVHLEFKDFLTPELHLPPLHHLRELRIKNCGVRVVPNSTFEGGDSLLVLDLSGNALKQIPALPQQLQDLDLSRNSIEALGANPLPVELKRLDLSNNVLRSFEEELFQNLAQLEELSASGNRLERVSSRSLSGLRALRRLELSGNRIAALEAGAFQELWALQHLRLAGNPLAGLRRLDLFGGRPQSVDLSDAGLDRMPQSLSRLVSELRLSRNALIRVSAGDLDSYPYLSDLELNECSLQEVEADAIGRLERLENLWLSRNSLARVPSPLPPTLHTLYLDGNNIAELLGNTFSGLSQLLHLTLRRNHIKKLLPCSFCDLRNLRVLDLRANRLESLPPGIFAPLENLETLDLSLNEFRSLDGKSFDNLARLATLQLSRVSNIIHVDNLTFDPLQSLRTLEMYDSPKLVHTLLGSTRLLHGLHNLQEVNIMHNKLSHLRSDFPSFFPNLKILKISGNMWHCDHQIQWLSTWIKQSNVQFYSSYTITCASPTNLQFKPLMMLMDEDFKDLKSESTENIEISSRSENITYNKEEMPHVLGVSDYSFENSSSASPSTTITTLSSVPQEVPTSTSINQINDKLIISFGQNQALNHFTTVNLSSETLSTAVEPSQNATHYTTLSNSSTLIILNATQSITSSFTTDLESFPTNSPTSATKTVPENVSHSTWTIASDPVISPTVETRKGNSQIHATSTNDTIHHLGKSSAFLRGLSNSLVSSVTLVGHRPDRVSRSALKATLHEKKSGTTNVTKSEWIFVILGVVLFVATAIGYLSLRLLREHRQLYRPQQDELSLSEGRNGY